MTMWFPWVMHDRIALRRAIGFLFVHAFWLYWPLYRIYKRRIDRLERAWVRGWLRDGDAVVDVGANIGVYSEYFAELVGSTGEVHAFEPDPLNYSRLHRLASQHPTIHPTQAAVGDRDGTIELFQSDGLNFDHHTYRNADDDRSVEVPLVRLDDVEALRTRPIRLVKIDVQGSDLGVLRGMTALLARNPEARVLVEYYPFGLAGSGSSPEDLIRFLREGAFTVSSFDPDPQLLFTGVDHVGDRDWYRNLVLSRGPIEPQGLTQVLLDEGGA